MLRRAALLHDLGKLGVSNLILDKPGKLTDEEFAEVRRHPAYSEQILRRVAVFDGIAEVAAAHHERLDGSGYHRGLVGSELSPAARVLAVADVFEAMTADRPYRPAMSVDEALSTMRLGVGARLCPVAFEGLRALARARAAHGRRRVTSHFRDGAWHRDMARTDDAVLALRLGFVPICGSFVTLL